MAHKTAADLAALADTAAHAFVSGEAPTLNQAIVLSVKTAGLNLEQVQRVVEQTNKLAYLKQHQTKLGEAQRIIEFNGGPARATEVLAQLNSTPHRFTHVSYDQYSSPPAKQASTESNDDYFQRVFGNPSGAPTPEQLDPLADCRKLATHLHDLLKQADAHRSSLESDLQYVRYQLVEQIKQARDEGVSLGQIVQAWSTLSPPPGLIKHAFAEITPELMKVPVWAEPPKLATDFQKLAAPGFHVDQTHPLMTLFQGYASTQIELEATTKVAEELAVQVADMRAFVREAEEKVADMVDVARSAANPEALGAIQRKLLQAGGAAGTALLASGQRLAGHVGSAANRLTDMAQEGLGGLSDKTRHALMEGGGSALHAMQEHPHLADAGAAALAATPLALAYGLGKRSGKSEEKTAEQLDLASFEPVVRSTRTLGEAVKEAGGHKYYSPDSPSSGTPAPQAPEKTAELTLTEAAEQGLLKAAARKGLLTHAADAIRAAGRGAGKGVEFVAKPLFDEGSKMPGHLGTAAKLTTMALPVALGAGAALKGYNHLEAATNTPAGLYVKSFIPGTDAYEEDKLRTQMAWGSPMQPMMY